MSTHIINVAFDFDDEKVKRSLEKSAESEILKSIKDDIVSEISKKSDIFYGVSKEDKYRDGLRKMVKDSIDTMLEDYKDEIVYAASVRLAERLSKTKTAKEMLKETIEEVKDGNGGEDGKVQ